jgi:uncharacterized membrane protein
MTPQLAIRLATGILVASASLIAWTYPGLPNQVPSHFNVFGDPDDWNGKGWVLILFGTAAIIHFSLIWISRHAKSFNVPVERTAENEEALNVWGKQLVLNSNVMAQALFAYIQMGIIFTALGYWNGLGPELLVLVLAMTGYIMVSVLRKMGKRKRSGSR